MRRIAFVTAIAIALTILAGLDLRLAFLTRDLATEAAALERSNGTSAVTFAQLDQHERRAASAARMAESTFGALDQHERPGRGLTSSSGEAVTFASLDQHERRAARTAATFAQLDQHERPGRGLASTSE